MVKKLSMKEKPIFLYFLLMLILGVGALSAQTAPPWTPITGNETNMVSYGNVYRNGVQLSGGGYWVATFGPGGIQNDCRSVRNISNTGFYYCTILGNTNGETIGFMIWDGNTSTAYQAGETLIYQADATNADFDLHFTQTTSEYTISGQITHNGVGLGGVTLSGLPGTIQSNAQGTYTATVPAAWSGIVTPTLTGYTFNPPNRSYTNVSTDYSGQNYTAAGVTHVISGRVTVGGNGLGGVTLSGLPGNPQTDASGGYSVPVASGWSATVTPSLNGYTFTPPNRSYSPVTSDQVNQDYTATGVTYTISGQITLNGTPLPGVTLSGLPGGPITDAGGNYSTTVSQDWNGTATPQLTGYNFSPPSRNYTGVNGNLTGQNYTASEVTVPEYLISGQVTLNGNPLPGVTMTNLPGNPTPTTDNQGNYSGTVPQGWTGTVIPVMTGYDFTPANTPYINVQGNMDDQDYTATQQGGETYTIQGTITLNGNGLAGVTLSGLPQTVTDASGQYSATVREGWTGTVRPILLGYAFTPASRTYQAVDQDYTTDYRANVQNQTVRFIAGANGRITGTLIQQVPYGGEATPVTAVPDAGYRFLSWTGPNGYFSLANPLIVNNVIADMTITANFAVLTPEPPPPPPPPQQLTGLHLINPVNGSRAYGIFMIVAEAEPHLSLDRVEFQIGRIQAANDHLLPSFRQLALNPSGNASTPAEKSFEIQSSPLTLQVQTMEMAQSFNSRFMTEWDTRLECCGWYKITVTGFQNGSSVVDEVTVYVNNVEFGLQVQRFQDRSLRITRDYAEITVKVSNWGYLDLDSYVLYRSDNNGRFVPLREFLQSELNNFTLTFRDCWLDKNKRYRYKIEAVDYRGVHVGVSAETSI